MPRVHVEVSGQHSDSVLPSHLSMGPEDQAQVIRLV